MYIESREVEADCPRCKVHVEAKKETRCLGAARDFLAQELEGADQGALGPRAADNVASGERERDERRNSSLPRQVSLYIPGIRRGGLRRREDYGRGWRDEDLPPVLTPVKDRRQVQYKRDTGRRSYDPGRRTPRKPDSYRGTRACSTRDLSCFFSRPPQTAAGRPLGKGRPSDLLRGAEQGRTIPSVTDRAGAETGERALAGGSAMLTTIGWASD